MKVVVLYRPNSQHSRTMEEFVQEYQRRYDPTHIEALSIDTRDGIAMATLYDIVNYPAILVVQNDGSAQKIWQGDSLPLMDEVVSYALS